MVHFNFSSTEADVGVIQKSHQNEKTHQYEKTLYHIIIKDCQTDNKRRLF